MGNNDAKREFDSADWEVVGMKLLIFVRYLARSHYGWRDGKLLPNGLTPEDITIDVLIAYANQIRKFSDGTSMWVQLKSTAKSQLSNLHSLKGNQVTSNEDPEFFGTFPDRKPTPDEILASREFRERFFKLLLRHPRVAKSRDLTKVVIAYRDGAQSIEEVAEMTGLPIERIGELRRNLKVAAEEVLKKMKRDGDL